MVPGAMALLTAAGLDLAVMEKEGWAERIRQDVHSERLRFGINTWPAQSKAYSVSFGGLQLCMPCL